MSTITFANSTPVAGLPFNPGLEEVLDPSGQVTKYSASLYEITNKSGGPLDGFQVQLHSNAGDFTYSGSGSVPTGGKIDGITVKAPDGTTIILTVAPGTTGFGDQDLVDFYNRLFDVNAEPGDAVFTALNQLLSAIDTINGSGIADHLTNFGFSDRVAMLGGGGDDVVWNQTGNNYANAAVLVGQAGNDVLRVEHGYVQVHGAEQNGAGGEAETNILEVVAKTGGSANVNAELVTDINVLRFAVLDPGAPVLDDTNMSITFDASQVAAGLLSPTLAVEGSTTPLSDTQIHISTDTSASNTTPVVVDLSGWTFTNWRGDEYNAEKGVTINTNHNAVANDVVVGTMVGDSISTYSGDDMLRGGGGGDSLNGGYGNDTLVYGANEADEYEYANGGDNNDPGVDTVLLLGSNDFTQGWLYEIEQVIFQGAGTTSFGQWSLNYSEGYQSKLPVIVGDGNANGLAFVMQKGGGGYTPTIDLSDLQFQSWTAGSDIVSIRGTDLRDAISGSTQNDVIAGGDGKDDLQGNAGADAFLFDTAFGKGVDHIVDFNRSEGDMIQLDDAIFGALKLGDLKKKAFATGTKAEDKKDRLIYDKEDGVLRYDDDGSGKHKAHIVAILDDASSLKFGDILVI